MIQLSLDAIPSESSLTEGLTTRECLIKEKINLRTEASALGKEAKVQPSNSPERNRLYRVIQQSVDEQNHIENVLQSEFLPQHGPSQLISPRAFFSSPLFRVGSKKIARERSVTLQLKTPQGSAIFGYTGPELRQSDGLVFMALLNQARDSRLGEEVSFQVDDLCTRIFGRYDGPTRQLLLEHIKRLQRGLIEFDRFSVQLCLRFDHPARGVWKVALDKDIVQLFKRSTEVWLDLPKRQALTEGLSSWLYGFIESQTKLIPMSLSYLRELCGSDAQPESFIRMFRLAMKDLESQKVVDDGWSLKKGYVHWRKL